MRRVIAGGCLGVLVGCAAAGASPGVVPVAPASLASSASSQAPAVVSPAAVSPAAASLAASSAGSSSPLAAGWSAAASASFTPFMRPPSRREGGDRLVVDSPPAKPRYAFFGRLRIQIEGGLTLGSERLWIGPEVPVYVPLEEDGLELFLLDPMPDGAHLAFYREPYGGRSCRLGASINCRYLAALFGADGKVVWARELSPWLSRPDHLEIQDIRYADGVLYFNEACQGYARDAGGACSALVAVDPAASRVLWRTPHRTSNNVFEVVDRELIVAGYGFTAEARQLSLIRRSDGAVVSTLRMADSHNRIIPLGGGRFEVYPSGGGALLVVRVEGSGAAGPRLVREALVKR